MFLITIVFLLPTSYVVAISFRVRPVVSLKILDGPILFFPLPFPLFFRPLFSECSVSEPLFPPRSFFASSLSALWRTCFLLPLLVNFNGGLFASFLSRFDRLPLFCRLSCVDLVFLGALAYFQSSFTPFLRPFQRLPSQYLFISCCYYSDEIIAFLFDTPVEFLCVVAGVYPLIRCRLFYGGCLLAGRPFKASPPAASPHTTYPCHANKGC
jgi:hypothetical protein